MTEKELRNLKRADLLEMLLASAKQVEELQAQHAEAEAAMESRHAVEKKEMQEQIAQLQKKLTQRRIAIANSGSIAEASLQLNQVFEAAQNAADQYLENIQKRYGEVEQLCQEREEDSRKHIDVMLSEAQAKCDELERQAQERADAIMSQAKQAQMDTETQCAAMVEVAQQKADQYWQTVSAKLQEVINTHEYLQAMFKDLGTGRPNES